jgi:TolA-binding protein
MLTTIRIVCLLLLLSASACSGARLDALEKSTKADIRDLRGLQAESTTELDQIRQDLREIQGQIQELQHVSQGKAQQLEQSLRQLGARVPPPPGVPEDLLSKDEERISRIAGAAAEGFKSALASLRAGDFESALGLFTNFTTQNPGTAFTDNSLFWSGICYIKTGRYDQAVVTFSDVYQTYPAEDMVAPALFYLADAFERLGSAGDARDTLQKLIDEHANSPLAAAARSRVRDLKRGR